MLCGVAEYDELPVRHNEDKLNMTLSESVRFPIKEREADDPHAKAKLLLQVKGVPKMSLSRSDVGWHGSIRGLPGSACTATTCSIRCM